MKALMWILRVLMFFILFTFALQNQHPATIKWPFGYQWESKTVFIVLAAFALGCTVGVLAMLPSWWRHKGMNKEAGSKDSVQAPPTNPPERVTEHPPRDGL
jgi:putative membrane protein